jgi:hypothetical protein
MRFSEGADVVMPAGEAIELGTMKSSKFIALGEDGSGST